ncbi:glycoside hydrolase family 65 protein [Empedobacter stercoris]|uniref:Glycoside hydrolase family 65 protein n=1 Tax=Empedobacter stercoris TaxID=1628248 RepID=A0ABX1WLV8_9FLAO|nr:MULTISPECIES: glycoside hydrolase family 65 protein [Empedobacter]MCA4808466.1 glycoside hydrolase family 65 protein [Empedobacter stercoris]MDM1523898.1 glycoside hydrolase family 65 protein [Empedobacter sp. 225-1]MDM1543863.1 glycoside hydrolase family 65 protein [Empedobacter sp. 189-2]NOJ75527.1 glycoside hydrolase family 65 protein [Empedobacter stercoris]QNT15573.1 glycoside hydrolase family 65 protein [Empedobacter stercoris]
MNQDYIIPNAWSIIEEGFEKDRVKSSESLFSIGNGAMGQRANFEEFYSGDTFQGSYIAGVYYPDKTKVGWWKNGYPEYFAKVLNAPVWIGINIEINGEQFDLNTCKEIKNFRRELNMKEGLLDRSFVATLPSGLEIEVFVRRFLSADLDELGVIKYDIKPLNGDAKIVFKPYVDAGVKNEDANWEETFWEPISSEIKAEQGFVQAQTFKTHFNVVTFMESKISINGSYQQVKSISNVKTNTKVEFTYEVEVKTNDTVTIEKFGGYVVSTNHFENELISAAEKVLEQANNLGYEQLLINQKEAWAKTWEMADITIDGDTKAQQGIRFNIFQLNQTYSGKDARLNIGPKGFTGEKYGGSTYWDTEAYCLPFYMVTKDQKVARNLLMYRYNQLDKAIENGAKLGFNKGAALYPMVTMNGEECHNEWEITFEEIHRNGAIAFAIYNYTRFTGDESYIPEAGLEVLLGIARFWKQRVNWSNDKKQYVMLGVTGPNEYENNVNNNFHSNYCAQWCMNYLIDQVENVKTNYPQDFERIVAKTNLTDTELAEMKNIAANIYFPFSEELGVYLQQDGFLDKDLTPVSELSNEERPINQKWSWDRILRSAYIKQADVLQSFYYFEDHFTKEQLEKHFDFYEPLTVHESSLSPCVHSIQAATLGRMNQAYTFYLRTSRLDLDDYNKEVHEGLHITSMAGTWMSIVEGFGGMRVKNDQLYFEPRLPEQWKGFSFKINFRNQILKVNVNKGETTFELEGTKPLEVYVFDQKVIVQPSI